MSMQAELAALAAKGNVQVGNGELRICKGCANPFIWYDKKHYNQAAEHCPKCCDIRQQRPSIVQERILLSECDGVEITSLPGDWENIHSGREQDRYGMYKITKKGRDLGISWSGRIDIFADEPFKVGDVVKVREMKSVHLVKQMRMQVGHVQKTAFDPPTHLVERTVPVQTEPEDVSDKAELIETTEGREYIVFETTEAEPSAQLVWYTDSYKTTLKGYGRQIPAKNVTGAPLMSWRVSGSCRSGRYGTNAILAVVDPQHYLLIDGVKRKVCRVEHEHTGEN